MSSETTPPSDAQAGAAEDAKAAVMERERAYLREVQSRPLLGRLAGYVVLSGPGWLQSALTLGGGSLSGSLYLGVIAGMGMLWLQPVAMILGIIMLSAIGYVTLSTGQRPFRAIVDHVNPALGWGWLIASMLANMVWSLPQYSLASGVLQQNLLPGLLGPDSALGDFKGKLVISVTILVLSTIITWSYGSGHWGVRLYERMLKVIVGLIVAAFIGVVVSMTLSEQGLDWSAILAGFIPDFGAMFRPADGFVPLLEPLSAEQKEFWSSLIVAKQRDVMMTAFATAVGINMTFLLPYSMLGRGWGKEHRGLAIFDLSTGMFIPYVVATSCVVIAASQFFAVPQPGFVGDLSVKPAAKHVDEFNEMMADSAVFQLRKELGDEKVDGMGQTELKSLVDERIQNASEAERRVAATLVTRDAQALSRSLEPLTGRLFADVIFGFGVLGMALSTITLLMLVSGFVVCEVLEVEPTGWTHRLGCLAAATGALGPFIWGKAAFWLAVPTSVFGLVLLPLAYLTFFAVMNQPKLLKENMPRGAKRFFGNLLMGVAAAVSVFASGWALVSNFKGNEILIGGGLSFFVLAVIVTHFTSKAKANAQKA